MPGSIRSTKAKGPWVGSPSAPYDASFVVMALDGVLSQERKLTAGSGITITDGGANGNVTISLSTAYDDFIELTDAATVSIDASAGKNFKLTIGGNRTLENPSNPDDGKTILIRVTQDGTGGRTLAFDSDYRFSTDLPEPILSTVAGTTDYLRFIYNGDDSKWDYIGQVFGF